MKPAMDTSILLNAGSNRAPDDIPMDTAIRAVEWHLQIQAARKDQQLYAQLQTWLSAHPDHSRAWRRIEEVNARFGQLASSGAHHAIQTALNQPPSRTRREVLKYLAVMLGLTGGAWTVQRSAPWQSLMADYRTGIGEQRSIALSDGTRIIMNTDTVLNVSFTDETRYLELLQGEVSISTGKDRNDTTLTPALPRPMIVSTRYGSLRPVGTRFAVRQYSDRVRLDVFEGAVQIQPVKNKIGDELVEAGQRVFFNSAAIGALAPLDQNDTSWIDNVLVASGMRLGDFLAELNRYRAGYLTCDPAIADLRVSGTYPLQNTDHILNTLPRVLPIEVRYLSRYWVRILPKSV